MRRALISTVAISLAMLAAAACSSSSGGDDANLASCGNIEVEASAKCEVEVEGGCNVRCEPVNFTAECSGRCTGQLSANCTASCQADCSGTCEADPGNYECEGGCQASCTADCEGKCEASNNSANCAGKCEATCQGECSVSCDGTPPSATCEAKCSAGCEGECKVEANIDCQLDCHAELSGGCEASCTAPEGALFCDGQYVDHGGNMAECIRALNAVLDVEVNGSASAACEGGACSAEAEGSISCAVSVPEKGSRAPWGALVAVAAAIGLSRRRRRIG